jgi:hypothetical protein
VYGVYKTAVIAVNTAHKVQAAMQATVTAGQIANASATKGQILYTTLLTKAQKALNTAMLTNPWVIAATAVAALSVGIYALANAEKDEERGVRRAREEHEKYQSELTENANKSKGYFNTLKDNTKTIEEQAEAWKKLSEQTKAFEGMSIEEVQGMSEKDFAAKLKEYNDKQAEEKNKNNISSLKIDISKLEGDVASYDEQIISGKIYGPALDGIRRLRNEAYAELEEKRGMLKVEEDIEAQRLAIVDASNNKKLVKNKEYWEKLKADAEESRNALDISEKGGTEWNKLTENIKKAEEALQAWNDTEEENLNLQKQLQAYQEDTDNDIANIQSTMKLDALKKELEYTNDINKKLEIQEQINDHIIEQKIKEHKAETDTTIKNTISEEDYAKYKSGKTDEMSKEGKQAVDFINENALREENAIRAQYERESNQQLLEMKVDAYRKYAEEVLRIEQEKADRINEINENEDLSDEDKKIQTQQVEENARTEVKLLSASSGVGSDIIAEVETLVNDIMGYSTNEIFTQLETINNEINAKIEELQTSLEGDIPEDQRAEVEKQITSLKTKQNLLIQKGTTLIKKQSKETKKSQGETKKWINLSEEQADAIGASSKAFGAVGAVADEVLSECGDMMSDTAKDALKAVSSIATFAQGAFDLITQAAEITDTTSKSIMASNIIGWIMLAVQALVKLGTFLSQYSAENKLKAEIEALADEVDNAQHRYEMLEKTIKLEGNVGSKALKDKIRLSEDLNDVLDAQNKQYAKTQELYAEQLRKYGYGSDKTKETRDDMKELEKERMETLQKQKDLQMEVFEELATTDFTSFAEDMASAMVDGFSEGLHGMETAYNDTVNNLIKEQLTKSLSLKIVDSMKPAFDRLESMTKDAELTEDEISDFKQMLDNVKNQNVSLAEKYREIMEDYGLLDDAEIESESKGFETMSQDTADELNGRFAALQMSGANIDQNTLLMTQQNVELLNHSRSIAEQATISTQIAQQQLYELREIKDNTAVLHSLDDRLRNIESYTSKL